MSGTGTAKLRLILEMQNRLKTGLNGAKQQVDNAVGGMQGKLNSFSKSNVKAFEAIKSEVPGVGRLVGMLSNPYIAAAAAAVALGAAIWKCTKMAADWDEKMGQINVTAELTREELNKLSDKLLEIGTRMPIELDEVPKAFNRIISAGLSVNDSLEMLEPTLKAAKATATELEIVAAAATSVKMSSGREAVEVFDILTQTLKDGSAEFKDIAQYLPKIIPIARNVGFELEETAGAYASLTGKLGARQSTTALEGFLRSLSNTETIKKFKAMKIDVFDKDGSVRSMTDIVKDTKKQFEGLTDEQKTLKFDKLGLDQMGALGLSTLMQDIEGMEKATNNAYNSAGALQNAYEASLTPMDKWRQIQNNIKVGMIQIGQKFLPILSEIGQKILDVIDSLKKMWEESTMLRDAVSILGKIFVSMFKQASRGTWLIINCFKTLFSIIGWVTEKIFGVGDGIEGVYKKVRPYLKWIFDIFKSIGNMMYNIATFNFSGLKKEIENFKTIKLEVPKLQEIKSGGFKSSEKEAKGTDPASTPPILDPDADKKSADDAKKIASGSQTKQVNITFRNFVEHFTTSNSDFAKMNKAEVERFFTDMLTRIVQSNMQ
jgi:TP901 family phage tail tape measure protein